MTGMVLTGLASPASAPQAASALAASGHPRLCFGAQELVRLRRVCAKRVHRRIWRNIAASAEWCLTQELRGKWIAPVSPAPIHLNLYDRFCAMMHDMAVVEHLAFAYGHSGEARYVDAGRRWTLACCRLWQPEADGAPDASKAYAVTRLLKGVAVSYDLLCSGLTEAEREHTRTALLTVEVRSQ